MSKRILKTVLLPLLIFSLLFTFPLSFRTYALDPETGTQKSEEESEKTPAYQWEQINGKWYYISTDTKEKQTGWQLIDGSWYYFDASGIMQTGWLLSGKTWYFLSSSGAMQTGWQKVGGRWYYLDPVNGDMKTGWQKVDGTWYYLLDYGAMATGWIRSGANWYLLAGWGAMLTGWQKEGGRWYYLDPVNGDMKTGWQKVDGTWYFLRDYGAMATGWISDGANWYLLADWGAMLTGWQKVGGIWYFLKPSGAMVSETYTVDGKKEVFHTSGAWIYTDGMDKKAAGYSSNTDYLILVDLTAKVTKIYRKYGSGWNVEQAYLCTVGDSSKGWNTIRGDFYIGQSSWGNPVWHGYSFNDVDNHTLYYWTRFCDDFLFHSILYENGTWIETPYGNDLGKELSHGCVRMRAENAKWIYDNIPYGTRVIVY